jgi:hypothetical protein
MSYIIGLTGTHGTGKSTILQGAKTTGFNVVESQLSRAAQKALGWDSLKRAGESVDNMWALQDAILHAMDSRDTEIRDSKTLTVVERTPADMWAYTEMWCKRLNIDIFKDELAYAYRQKCRLMCGRYATFVYIPMSDEIPFVEDPHRADLASRLFVAEAIDSFLWFGGYKMHKLKSVTKEDRSNELAGIMESING